MTPRCDLYLERSNPIFSTGHWPMMLYYQTKFGCKLTNSLEDITEIVALTVTLTLNTVNQFFCMTLWLMMLHNHTRSGNNCGSEDIVWTNITGKFLLNTGHLFLYPCVISGSC